MRTITKMLATFGLGLALMAPGGRAQTNSADGPSLQVTLDYINSKVLSIEGYYRNGRISVSSDHETIFSDYDIFYPGESWHHIHWSANALSLENANADPREQQGRYIPFPWAVDLYLPQNHTIDATQYWWMGKASQRTSPK
jgi:hypothetical protein